MLQLSLPYSDWWPRSCEKPVSQFLQSSSQFLPILGKISFNIGVRLSIRFPPLVYIYFTICLVSDIMHRHRRLECMCCSNCWTYIMTPPPAPRCEALHRDLRKNSFIFLRGIYLSAFQLIPQFVISQTINLNHHNHAFSTS